MYEGILTDNEISFENWLSVMSIIDYFCKLFDLQPKAVIFYEFLNVQVGQCTR